MRTRALHRRSGRRSGCTGDAEAGSPRPGRADALTGAPSGARGRVDPAAGPITVVSTYRGDREGRGRVDAERVGLGVRLRQPGGGIRVAATTLAGSAPAAAAHGAQERVGDEAGSRASGGVERLARTATACPATWCARSRLRGARRGGADEVQRAGLQLHLAGAARSR